MPYDKNSLKENLSIEDVYRLLNDLGGEPVINNNILTAKTICHGGQSHKLYYYPETHLFHCYTGCGDASFDIYDLIIRINKVANNILPLSKAILFIAKYFGYEETSFDFNFNQNQSEDWKIINKYKNKNNKNLFQKNDTTLKIFNNQILKYLPHPRIYSWEQEGIKNHIIQSRGICYNPIEESVIIPHFDINNNLIGIRERTLIKENEIYGKYKPAILNGIMYNHPLGLNLYNLNISKNNIKKFKKVIVFQGEKSTLKYASYFGNNFDISVACCGSNLTNYQINLLISLGVQEIIIAFDKQFQKINDEEWKIWTNKLTNLYNKYGNFINISYMFDKNNLLKYKDSPIDNGKDIFTELFQKRITIE